MQRAPLTGSSSRVGRFGPRSLGFRLLVMVLIPVLALQVFAWREVHRQNVAASSAADVSDQAELLLFSGNLIVPLYLELTSTHGMAEAEARGVDRADLQKITGTSFLGIMDGARLDLDKGLEALAANEGDVTLPGGTTIRDELTDVRASLTGLRSGFDARTADAATIENGYEQVITFVQTVNHTAGEALMGAAVSDDLRGIGAETGQLIASLEYASTALDELSDAAISGDPQASLVSMIGASASFDASIRQLRELIDPSRRARFDQIVNSPDFTAVAKSLPTYIDAVSTAADTPEQVVTRPEDIKLLTDVLLGSFTRLELLKSYGNSFLLQEVNHADDVQATAESARRLAIGAMVLSVLVSLILLVLVIRSVLRPLGRLARRSRQVREGDLSGEPEKPIGPTDLRVVTRAFNDMVTTLKAYESQLDRLAQGDTEVDESLPGPLGDTVRRSVSQLATVTSQLHESHAAANVQARTDSLTGLANRTAAMERLSIIGMQARQDGHTGAIIFLDLDGFKSVNDTQGHSEGDRILTELADRVRRACPLDVVARIGGDEFLVLMERAESLDRVTARARELIAAISAPCTGSGGQLFTLSASAGVAMVDGLRDPLASVAQADSAVYHAKERGRGRVEAFDERLAHVIEERAEMALTMRHGLAQQQFSLCLQPIIDIATSHPIGAEVLLRWNRPGVGEIGPSEFIPIAERTGVIVDLESWVLEEAVGILRDWRLDATTSRMRLAVNISGRHIVEGNLVSLLDELCRRANVNPNLLDLEITETHLVADIARAGTVVDDLRAQGVNVAIDDFGTGYSSMSYLHRLTVDTLKIDQVFVAGMCDDRLDRTIVELLLRLGDSLGLKVVAEGVDSEQKLSLLRELGCPWAQGYYIARPMAVADATRWLRQQEALASSLA